MNAPRYTQFWRRVCCHSLFKTHCMHHSSRFRLLASQMSWQYLGLVTTQPSLFWHLLMLAIEIVVNSGHLLYNQHFLQFVWSQFVIFSKSLVNEFFMYFAQCSFPWVSVSVYYIPSFQVFLYQTLQRPKNSTHAVAVSKLLFANCVPFADRNSFYLESFPDDRKTHSTSTQLHNTISTFYWQPRHFSNQDRCYMVSIVLCPHDLSRGVADTQANRQGCNPAWTCTWLYHTRTCSEECLRIYSPTCMGAAKLYV